MRELLLIFNLKAHTFLKKIFEWKLETVAKDISSLLIFGGFAVGVFILSRTVTLYLLQEAHIGQFLFHRFLSMLLYVFFITVNLGNMIVSYATLYRSQEVNFLMALPLTHQKIFLIKFVDNFFYSSTTLSLIGFAVLLGYGSCFDMPWYFYFFTMFFIMVPFMLIAGILAVLVLMSLIKIAARIGVRWLLAILALVYLSAIYLYFRIVNPIELVQSVMRFFPNVNQYFGHLDPPFVKYLPNHWVTEFLYWSVTGSPERGIPYFMILFLTMLGLVVVAGIVAYRYYFESWVLASDASSMLPEQKRKPLFQFFLLGKEWLFRPQTESVLRRDFWLFFREPSQWLHMLLMILLMMIFLVSIGSLDLQEVRPFLLTISVMIVFLFDGFLIASIALRFVFPLISLEGDAFWIVRSAPVSLHRLYWQKFTMAAIGIVPIALILSLFSISMLRGHTIVLLVTGIVSTLVAFSLVALNLSAGTFFAMFNERNPIRIASSQGASLTFLLSMVYLTLVIAILIGPLGKFYQLLIARGVATAEWIYFPLASIAILSVLVIWLSSTAGLRAIHKDF